MIEHNVHKVFPLVPGQERPVTNIANVCLPTQGRLEREHLYLWMIEEENYVAGKFDDQRDGHDDSMREEHLRTDGFWLRQIVQYYDRARLAFDLAADLRKMADEITASNMTDSDAHAKAKKSREQARFMEMKGQQALAKAFMTAKGACESSIRVFGPLPKPGLSSGYVEEWT